MSRKEYTKIILCDDEHEIINREFHHVFDVNNIVIFNVISISKNY